jgi:hypothetical protein
LERRAISDDHEVNDRFFGAPYAGARVVVR